MSDSKGKDELLQKAIQAVENSKTYPKGTIQEKLAYKIAVSLATEVYKKTKNDKLLIECGKTKEEINNIKRKRGALKKNMYSDEDIVQLIFKQRLQAGLMFTDGNTYEKENSPCFLAVAANEEVSVDIIIRQYKRVPKARRKEIKERLKVTLEEHGLLHERHLNKKS